MLEKQNKYDKHTQSTFNYIVLSLKQINIYEQQQRYSELIYPEAKHEQQHLVRRICREKKT